MDAMKIANSIPMWIACGIPVILVIAQALIFAKKSYSAGKKIGLTEKQMKNAIKSSAITSIGPSIVILKWNAFPSDHCWRTDGVDETFPDRFRYV